MLISYKLRMSPICFIRIVPTPSKIIAADAGTTKLPPHREYGILDDGLSHRYHLPRGLPVC